MSKFNSPLNNVSLSSPCQADWNEMYGNERKRFCSDCKLNVYNLSGMSKSEAESLLINSEGRLCVRFFRRADGSIITKDCPVGWARVKRRSRAIVTAVFSLIASLFGGLMFVSIFAKENNRIEVGKMVPISTPTPKPTPDHREIMGAIAMPSPTPKQKPTPDQEFEMGKAVIDHSPQSPRSL